MQNFGYPANQIHYTAAMNMVSSQSAYKMGP